MNGFTFLFGILFYFENSCYGKLNIKSWPSTYKEYRVRYQGASILQCEVESDHPFTLKWYVNGKEHDMSKTFAPYWYHPFGDGTGAIFIQYPYIPQLLVSGEFECRASNGVDPVVSKKVKYTALAEGEESPKGFPQLKTAKARGAYRDIVLDYGSNYTFKAEASGENLDYRWFFRNVPLHKRAQKGEKDDTLKYSISADGKALNIFNVGKIDKSADITWYALNDIGIVDGPIFNLKTKPRPDLISVPSSTTTPVPLVPPKIIIAPKNVSVGGPEQWVEFTCKAIGHPKPIYIWYHDERIVTTDYTGYSSVVAMKTGKMRCRAHSSAGEASATAYLFVKPIPYRPNPVTIIDRGTHHFTIEIKPYSGHYKWHKNIVITHAIIDQRPYVYGQPVETPYNQTKIALSGPPPWKHVISGLHPWMFVDVRVRLVNEYGVGNVSDWNHGTTKFAPITEPVRDLKATPLSAKSFRVEWKNPERTNGPLSRYEVLYTKLPHLDLKHWQLVGVDRWKQSLVVDWTNKHGFTEVAPVLYWKVRLVGFVNEGPYSETKVFKCLPGAPGFVTDVKLKVLSSRTIQVSWKLTTEEGSGVIAHDILYNRQDVPAWETEWKVHESKDPKISSVVLNDLSPNRPYEVVVYPRTKETRGVPSKIVIETTLPDAPTAPPQNIRGTAKHSQTLEIFWDPPPKEHQNAPITKYELFYTLHNREPTKVEINKDARKFQLQGLGKYKKYKIWMVAYNAIGKSPPSAQYEIVTKEDVPDGAPQSVQAQALDDSTIAITWRPPKTVLQNGRIIGYKIYYLMMLYHCTDDTEKKLDYDEVEVSGADTKDVVITKFIFPGKNYKIMVAARTSVGLGPKSLYACIKTPEKRSAAPKMEVNVDRTDNVVTLKWWPPTGDIVGYKIEYGKTLHKFDSLIGVKMKEVGSNVRISVFDDLDSGVFYSFKLYAILSKNKGLTAPNTHWLKTSDGIPKGEPLYFTATSESSSSIKLKWEEPDAWLRSGRIVGYEVFYKRNDKDVNWLRARYDLRGEEDAVIYILQNLKSNTRYAIKVKARTAVGSGKATQVLYAKTNKEVLPVVELLRATEVKSISTLLRWDRPKQAAKFEEYTMKYEINLFSNHTYRTDTGERKWKYMNRTETVQIAREFYLDNLTPGTNYHVTVRVDLQDAGIGDPISVSFTTKPDKPKSVKLPEVDHSNRGEKVKVNVPAVSEANGPISHCSLVVVVLDTSNIPNGLQTSQYFFNDGNDFRRRRRDTTLDNEIHLPDAYIARDFKNEDLPTVFKLGDGSQSGRNFNRPLKEGKHYTTFIRAYVVIDTNPYQLIHTDSNFTKPLKYSPTKIGVTEASSGSNESAGGGMMTIIIAAVAAVLVIVIVAVILVFIIRKRKKHSSESDYLLAKKRKGSVDPSDLHRLQSNAPGMMQHPPIQIDRLAQYVDCLRANNGAKLLKEFESIDPERQPCEASLLPQNKMKNRYPNVLAYDHTRVKLDHTGVLCSDYINANYVDGYCKEKAYISTQGPLKSTVDDFWRLCWEQNVQSIVMLTRLEERGRNKCEQYWPSSGSEVYDNIKVTIKEEKVYCNYCIRAFEVCSNLTNDTRIVKHFQYLQWPDPGVPLNFGPVLAFVRRVRSFDPPGCGPMVVHCSAGIGRSACFIAIDAMLERLKHDSMIDIYGYVTMMRTQRNFMVQTDEQYIFIYDVLVEAIQYQNTEIVSTDLVSVYKNLTELQPNGLEPILERQFNWINASSNYYDPSVSGHANLRVNSNKNRCRTIVPFDNNRVVLQPIFDHDGSDYINASYVDGFYSKGAFIATQGPLENTAADFWRMVMEQECSIIVMLSSLEEQGKQQCAQYWPSTQTVNHYYYVIDPVQEKRFANFTLREFKVTDARDSTSRVIRHYQYNNWSPSTVPTSSEGVLELIGQVQKLQQKIEKHGPIVVHGSTGSGRVGVYIALSIALESLRAERLVDIYQIVKTLRQERPYMVQSFEQYEFIYRVACDFLKNFDFVV